MDPNPPVGDILDAAHKLHRLNSKLALSFLANRSYKALHFIYIIVGSLVLSDAA